LNFRGLNRSGKPVFSGRFSDLRATLLAQKPKNVITEEKSGTITSTRSAKSASLQLKTSGADGHIAITRRICERAHPPLLKHNIDLPDYFTLS
jgi:hypothetical protein